MQLVIPPGDFQGYLFDLDGTLIDSMPIHYRAWDAALHRFGLRETLDKDKFYSLGGVPTLHVAEILGAHYGLTLDPEEVAHQKEILYKDYLVHGRAKVIEPVAAWAREAAKKGLPRAIVTGGTPDVAQAGLESAGLQDLFQLVVTPHDVPPGRGKPAPDMFLLAAREMGVPPEQCLVFEDAEPGIQGARAAGMAVVVVPSRLHPSGP
jgi:HAD superfamily hydrolase (TIGR01509 family)